MNNYNLQTILGNNVVELDFVRRHPKLGWSNVRAVLGTTNYPLLNGEFGYKVLHFTPPKGVGMGYDYKSKNLCVIWDMFRQEYRVFGAEQVNIRKQFDLSSEESQQEFMDYFYEFIINMPEDDKLKFMGYMGETISNQKTTSSQVSISSRIQKFYQKYKDKVLNFFKRKQQ